MSNIPIIGKLPGPRLISGIIDAIGGSSGSTPAPASTPAPVAAPTRSDAGVQDASQRARAAAAQARGRGSTVLTGALGSNDPVNLRRRTLGGG